MYRNQRRRPNLCLFPGYNWCGPWCNGPGEPINEVDAACKEHDICYQKTGNRCKCDREFINRLNPYIVDDTEQGKRARTMYKYMRIQAFFNCDFL